MAEITDRLVAVLAERYRTEREPRAARGRAALGGTLIPFSLASHPRAP